MNDKLIRLLMTLNPAYSAALTADAVGVPVSPYLSPEQQRALPSTPRQLDTTPAQRTQAANDAVADVQRQTREVEARQPAPPPVDPDVQRFRDLDPARQDQVLMALRRILRRMR